MTPNTGPAVTCQNLSVGHGGTAVLENLTFTLERATTLALAGRSGCGKTTLVKTLAGIIEPIEGEATVLGEPLPRSPRDGRVGYIPQNLGLVKHATVRRNVLHGTLADLGWTRSLVGRFSDEAEHAAQTALATVGLAGMGNRQVTTLSGGERRRVAIARAFVQRPQLLLADEMLSELDGETAHAIVRCLRSMQAETGMAVVLVEHDLEIVDSIADQLLQLDAGPADRRLDPDRSGTGHGPGPELASTSGQGHLHD